MSDLSLSQDEIDALLMGGGAPPSAAGTMNEALKSALTGYFADIVGAQAAAVGGMIEGKPVKIDPPAFDMADKDGFLEGLPAEIVEIVIPFSSPSEAGHTYFFDPSQLQSMLGPIMGQESVEINENAVNALEEVGSLLAGSMVTNLSTKTGQDVSTNPPKGEKKPKAMATLPAGNIVRGHFRIHINGDVLDLWEALPMELMESLTGTGGGSPDAGGMADSGGTGMTGFNPQAAGMGQMGGMGGQMGGMGGQMGNMGAMGGGMAPPNIQGVQLPNLMPGLSSSEMGNIGLLMDVTMEVTVELGRAKRQIKDILGMGEGTIIALDKLAGEAVDILVNHKLIAKGEVVVIDENFGVRVTEIVSGGDKLGDM
jgi:flagellar motor switch protein FliN/FliY